MPATQYPDAQLSIPLRDHPDPYTNALLRCPVCGFDYVHFTQMDLMPGSDERPLQDHISVSVTGEVNREEATDRETEAWGRRYQVSLAFECENGHSFVLDLTQNKGQMHMAFVDDELTPDDIA